MKIGRKWDDLNGNGLPDPGDPRSRTRVCVTVTQDLLLQGYVCSLPLVERLTAGDLAAFHHYALAEGPDGIAFGNSGMLYVAMATPARSGISVLRPDGGSGSATPTRS